METEKIDSDMEENLEEMVQKGSVEGKRKSHVKMIFYSFFNFLKTIALIVILDFIIWIFLIQPFIVEGQSMGSAFSDRDYLITEKVSYHFKNPVRGEAIIFHPPEDSNINYIKRVVGLPGDNIQIKDGGVYINSQRLIEPYLSSNEGTLVPNQAYSSLTLNSNQFYVLGDNRNHSRDSRELGPIPRQNIVSHVWFRLYPFNKIRTFSPVNYLTAS